MAKIRLHTIQQLRSVLTESERTWYALLRIHVNETVGTGIERMDIPDILEFLFRIRRWVLVWMVLETCPKQTRCKVFVERRR